MEKKRSIEETRETAQEYYQSEELYALLSSDKANWIDGISILYVGNPEKSEERVIYFFSTVAQAEACARQLQIEQVEGMYPITRLNTYEMQSKIDVLCSNAWMMGVNKLRFNAFDETDEFGCGLEYFMRENKISRHAAFLAGENEEDAADGEMDRDMPLRFQPLRIWHFVPPEKIPNDRAESLIAHLFQDKDSGIQYYMENADLTEMCFLINYIRAGLIKLAEEQGKPEDAAWFRSAAKSLCAVLYIQMKACQNLYTIYYTDTDGKLYTEDGYAYLLYSNRCKNGLHPEMQCTRIPDLDEFLCANEGQGFLVTDKIHDTVAVPMEIVHLLLGTAQH